MNFQTLFDILMTEYLERHSPERRIKKRKQQDESKRERDIKGDKTARDEKRAGDSSLAAARTRHIPRAVRDIDHVIPYAKGGDNSPGNLRLLCAKHNKLEAERAYGAGHMKKFYRRE